MSVTIDFSDLFKPKSEGDSNKRAIESLEEDFPIRPETVSLENVATADSAEWVKKCLRDMNYHIAENELSGNVIKCLQNILYERYHTQQQNYSIVADCGKLRSQLDIASREKENMTSQIAVLKQDLNFSNGKMAALKSEQRELRCQWLAEKSDLEGRCFQSMALVTQIQGTLRKKENDYSKLQQQLSKVVRDSQKPLKPITLSKPMPKSSSQARVVTLKDAELQAAQETILGLETENRNLRQAVNDLSASYGEFQARVTTVMAAQAQISTTRVPLITAGEGEGTEDSDPEDAENTPPLATPSNVKPSTALEDKEQERTPRADNNSNTRCEDSLAQDVLLRQAESVSRSMRRLSQQIHKESEGDDGDSMHIRRQLEDALAVIREQDWLIHVALVGKLPSLSLSGEVDGSGLCWADEDDTYGPHAGSEFSPRRASFSRRSSFGTYSASARKTGLGSRRASVESVGGFGSPYGTSFLDVLPPASPETMRVLEAAGWPLPKPLAVPVQEATSDPHPGPTTSSPFLRSGLPSEQAKQQLSRELFSAGSADLAVALGLD